MDEKAVVRRRRRDRSVAEAARLVADYESSGLSRQEFCQRNDVTVSTLSRYVTRHRRQNTAGAEQLRGLVSVEIAAPENQQDSELLVILNGGRRVAVRRGFDADTLEQLVRLLERF